MNQDFPGLGLEDAGHGTVLTLDTELLLDAGGFLDGFLVAVVPYGHVGARLGKALCNGQADSSSSGQHTLTYWAPPGRGEVTRSRTADNGGTALEREKRHDQVALRRRHGIMSKVATLHVGHGDGARDRMRDLLAISDRGVLRLASGRRWRESCRESHGCFSGMPRGDGEREEEADEIRDGENHGSY